MDMMHPVCEIVKELIDAKNNYLVHRSHVDNIAIVFPVIKEAFEGKCIELDFSKYLAMKPKHEVQSAHFSSKQYALHCTIVLTQSSERKYHYQFSDDTTHDPSYVTMVLEDIFSDFGIRDESVIIKSDNAPTQYKNLYAFKSYQNLANKFNTRIIRIYGAAGHAKGLIDAMSSFGVKAILRRDIIANDVWFQDSTEIVDYLTQCKKNKQFVYKAIKPSDMDDLRKRKDGLIVKNCMVQHLMVFDPNGKAIYTKEYLCDCEEFLKLNFSECLKCFICGCF